MCKHSLYGNVIIDCSAIFCSSDIPMQLSREPITSAYICLFVPPIVRRGELLEPTMYWSLLGMWTVHRSR